MKTFTELTPQERNDLICADVLKWQRNVAGDWVYANSDGGRTVDSRYYNFNSDLNACRLVQAQMDIEHRELYLKHLSEMLAGTDGAYWPLVNATASQKTEAILRAYNLIS